jgi:hypothetical protein
MTPDNEEKLRQFNQEWDSQFATPYTPAVIPTTGDSCSQCETMHPPIRPGETCPVAIEMKKKTYQELLVENLQEFDMTQTTKKSMIDPEHATKVVNTVLSQFATEEIGNKVTQFSMQGLANIMVGALMNPNSLKKPID